MISKVLSSYVVCQILSFQFPMERQLRSRPRRNRTFRVDLPPADCSHRVLITLQISLPPHLITPLLSMLRRTVDRLSLSRNHHLLEPKALPVCTITHRFPKVPSCHRVSGHPWGPICKQFTNTTRSAVRLRRRVSAPVRRYTPRSTSRRKPARPALAPNQAPHLTSTPIPTLLENGACSTLHVETVTRWSASMPAFSWKTIHIQL